MALHSELPVYRDTYNLLRKIYEITKNFSKEYRYTLGEDMKRDAMQLVRNIYRANKHKSERKTHLENFLDDFELVKLQMRLCGDMRLLTIKKHAELAELMSSIGRQIIGWRNSIPV